MQDNFVWERQLNIDTAIKYSEQDYRKTSQVNVGKVVTMGKAVKERQCNWCYEMLLKVGTEIKDNALKDR